jgi:hypothetical protein
MHWNGGSFISCIKTYILKFGKLCKAYIWAENITSPKFALVIIPSLPLLGQFCSSNQIGAKPFFFSENLELVDLCTTRQASQNTRKKKSLIFWTPLKILFREKYWPTFLIFSKRNSVHFALFFQPSTSHSPLYFGRPYYLLVLHEKRSWMGQVLIKGCACACPSPNRYHKI